MSSIETVYTTIYRRKKSFAGVIRIGIRILTTMIDGKPTPYTKILNITTITNKLGKLGETGKKGKAVIHEFPSYKKNITMKVKMKEPLID